MIYYIFWIYKNYFNLMKVINDFIANRVRGTESYWNCYLNLFFNNRHLINKIRCLLSKLFCKIISIKYLIFIIRSPSTKLYC